MTEPNLSLPPEPSEFLHGSQPPPPGQRDWRRVLRSAANYWFQQAQVKLTPLLRKLDWELVRNTSLVMLGGFVAASSVSTFFANSLINAAATGRKIAGQAEVAQLLSGLRLGGSPSSSEAASQRTSILNRNLFNSEGTLPAEDLASPEKKGQKTATLDFSKVPCSVGASLPVQVVGTIFTGDERKSFVTVKDPKISDTDTYKPGDVIIDHEDFEVIEVSRGYVIFRKGDEKICVGILDKSGQAPQAKVGIVDAAENTKQVEFDANYVAGEIGPGFANILNSHKLIPEVQGGKPVGFKMISINPGSLFDRIGFQNGDVLTDVNSVSLTDPSQGFKVYQALQEEREVTIKFLRKGEVNVRKVLIK